MTQPTPKTKDIWMRSTSSAGSCGIPAEDIQGGDCSGNRTLKALRGFPIAFWFTKTALTGDAIESLSHGVEFGVNHHTLSRWLTTSQSPTKGRLALTACFLRRVGYL
jgi:hypothetical protein